jgi:hypothetical protein
MGDIIKVNETNIISILHSGEVLKAAGKPFARQIYLIEAHIAGTMYVNNIEKLEPNLTLGKKLSFFREPDNPHDKLAIVVRDDSGNKVGYVPRDKNEVLARLMDAGKLIYGTIHEKEYMENWLKVSMQIYLDD